METGEGAGRGAGNGPVGSREEWASAMRKEGRELSEFT